MKFLRFVLGLLLAPVFGLLFVFHAFCSFVLGTASGILLIAGTLLGLLGIAMFFLEGWKYGLTLLVLAFLVSPYGLPAVVEKLLELAEHLRFSLARKLYN